LRDMATLRSYSLRLIPLILIAGLSLIGCGREKGEPLIVYCGTSFSKPIEEIGGKFKERFGADIKYNFAGCETIFPQILLTHKGDICIVHDPYADMLREKGVLEDDRVVGKLTPVLIVPKGNLKGIKSLEDLARPGIRVALGDPRFQTCAQYVHQKLKEKGIEEAVKKNIVYETKTHQELGNAIKLGTADVAVVWNFIAVLNSDSLDGIWMKEKFPETKIHVCLLNFSKNKELARKFLEFASSQEGVGILKRDGYR